MYESLLQHCSTFHLYIYAFDDICYEYLKKQSFKNLTVISLNEFENEELLLVKPSRTAGEYCWTCASSTIYHSITTFGLSNCTYIDADMLFYSNPKVLIDEMDNNSVLITSHRFSKGYEKSIKHGKYCVQFMTFKNTPEGMAVLNWWKDSCIDWCYDRVEDGKFGDQKYIDEFKIRFSGVHELNHLGGGVAPWNVEQYTFEKQTNGIILGTAISTGKQFELVFYHFHGLKFYNKNIVGLSEFVYCLNKQIQNLIYFPYLSKLHNLSMVIKKDIKNINPNGNSGNAIYKPKINLLVIFKLYVSELSITYKNIFGLRLFKRLRNYHYFYQNEILNVNHKS
jgi:hypothetical protein